MCCQASNRRSFQGDHMRVSCIAVLALVIGLSTACSTEKKDDSSSVLAVLAGSSGANCTAPTFVESAASTSAGQTQFNNQCTGCHGATGSGGSGPSLVGYKNRATYQTAAAKVHCTMPLGNPNACINDCARDVAAYIRTL